MGTVVSLIEFKARSGNSEIRLPEDAFVAKGLSLAGTGATGDELVEAHACFSLAALRGSGDARRHRIAVSQRMSGEQILRAQAEVHRYLVAKIG